MLNDLPSGDANVKYVYQLLEDSYTIRDGELTYLFANCRMEVLHALLFQILNSESVRQLKAEANLIQKENRSSGIKIVKLIF